MTVSNKRINRFKHRAANTKMISAYLQLPIPVLNQWLSVTIAKIESMGLFHLIIMLIFQRKYKALEKLCNYTKRATQQYFGQDN